MEKGSERRRGVERKGKMQHESTSGQPRHKGSGLTVMLVFLVVMVVVVLRTDDEEDE